MTTYQVTERQLNEYGKTFDEHPKFGPYRAGWITWVCLVTGERQSKYFALSNLKDVTPIHHTIEAVDMGIEFTCALPPHEANVRAAAFAFIVDADKHQTQRMASRKMYQIELYARINAALAEPKTITLGLTQDMQKAVNASQYVNIVTLWHESMRAA